MVLPAVFDHQIANVNYYQGVIVAEIASTLFLYVVLKIVHYVKWGAQEEADSESKDRAKADVDKKGESGQQDATTQKWNQKIWDVYFPIIYTNHMACLILSLVFYPYIFAAILAYLHFICFCGLLIINIFIKDAEEGQGNKTKASRIMWLIMCSTNIIQLISGLVGVAKVLP